jgi:hypothetical protein
LAQTPLVTPNSLKYEIGLQNSGKSLIKAAKMDPISSSGKKLINTLKHMDRNTGMFSSQLTQNSNYPQARAARFSRKNHHHNSMISNSGNTNRQRRPSRNSRNSRNSMPRRNSFARSNRMKYSVVGANDFSVLDDSDANLSSINREYSVLDSLLK